jgi:hypothetical protein
LTQPIKGKASRFLFPLALSAALASAVAAFMVYVLWHHTSQEELGGDVEWVGFLYVGVTWFVVVWLPSVGVLLLVWLMQKVSRSRRSVEAAG